MATGEGVVVVVDDEHRPLIDRQHALRCEEGEAEGLLAVAVEVVWVGEVEEVGEWSSLEPET